MPAAVADAGWLAGYLNKIKGLETLPGQPPTNLFHLLLPGSPSELVEYACDWSEQEQVFILPMPRAQLGSRSIVEFSLGRAFAEADRAQWESWLGDFFAGLPAKTSLRPSQNPISSTFSSYRTGCR